MTHWRTELGVGACLPGTLPYSGPRPQRISACIPSVTTLTVDTTALLSSVGPSSKSQDLRVVPGDPRHRSAALAQAGSRAVAPVADGLLPRGGTAAPRENGSTDSCPRCHTSRARPTRHRASRWDTGWTWGDGAGSPGTQEQASFLHTWGCPSVQLSRGSPRMQDGARGPRRTPLSLPGHAKAG